ncbi:flavin-containing monooxygenase [Croceibacterium aestuarii]|uniref:flavin-containing monooxygenase n=1 Tax=Croceibacterium aestuarii TaxID=3064139 RepID=UPI00272E67D4|nr:NAD(P)/FAD-dependent oxidoreductase [Croceibacterium sp. D39]
MTPQPDIDVAIVGAGISGISMAAHMKLMCPERSFAMFERRANIGGTWDLFRYPGIRSDSDMHTLGFKFEPWVHEKAIADAPAIRDYLDRIVHERGIIGHVRFESKVVSADWHSDEAMWHLTVEDPDGWQQVTARFLYLASGYYDYDDPHDAQLPGLDKFAGQVVHPQFWPEGLDYAGKKIVVIGSGATAVTIVPAMTDKASHVTMLQRTPTWMAAGPSRDRIANRLRKVLPEWLAYRIVRQKNIRLRDYLFKRARSAPDKVAAFLTGMLKKELGEDYPLDDFQPPYPPWDQRLCLVPDSDLFAALKAGTASVKTGQIESFEANGVRLKSGELLEAHIVITATGLRLALGGKVDVTLDGEALVWPDLWFYRGCMFSNVPNLAIVFGYLNASWTLRADNTSSYICRVLNRMHDKRADIAIPRLPDDHGMEEIEPFPFSSGYLQRAKHLVPKSAPTLPWRLNQDYLEDCRDFRKRPVDDGVLKFERLPAKTEAA